MTYRKTMVIFRELMSGASHGHHFVPLHRRAVARLFKLQVGTVGLAVWNGRDTRRRN
jgi:hypothetical protein